MDHHHRPAPEPVLPDGSRAVRYAPRVQPTAPADGPLDLVSLRARVDLVDRDDVHRAAGEVFAAYDLDAKALVDAGRAEPAP